MGIKEDLSNIFKSRNAGPFLFVGSGFSRRYLGLEDWRGLLTKYCITGKPFEYYLSLANGHYPSIAKLLADDFNKYWWEADEYKDNVNRYRTKICDSTSALRIEICNYLNTLNQTKAKQSEFANELDLLATLNVDGIITTNWDLFLEQIFPDYKVYIGQKELLFSNPQEIGEIYKIHGCSTQPKSLVLTDKDYHEFESKNAYLAAKLITLFVEHPIVFLGYSISDENISALLRAISLCIGKDNIEQLRKNLIFVQRLAVGEEQNLSDTYLSIDGVQIPLVLVKTNDFNPIYEAVNVSKRKIPARILRYCKEQMYELVQSVTPEEKICVVGIDEIESKDDIEFLVGVGVISKHKELELVSEVGYSSIQVNDLISDLLHENKGYDSKQIVESVLPKLIKYTPNIPVFMYLNKLGINSEKSYIESGIKLDKTVKRDFKDFRVNQYSKPFFRDYQCKSIIEVVDGCTPANASAYIPFIQKDKIDLDILKSFLVQHEQKIYDKAYSYTSNFKKLAALYDRLKWGW
jgi:SIR2-like domain